MRRHNVGQTGIVASHLGFGCVKLTTHRQRREAIRILDHAFALGITHFDVARAYGFGRAEGILGQFLRGKKGRVTVATKFGIQPPAGLTGNRRVIDLAKKILRPFPSLVRMAQKRVSQRGQSGIFTAQDAVQSLETSLRELGTDCIDMLLLHEATLLDAANNGLIETLQQQVSLGKIRCFGMASDFKKLSKEARHLSPGYKILQFDDNASSRNLQTLVRPEYRALITHSIFKPYESLRAAAVAQPALTRQYSLRADLPLDDAQVIGSLLLEFALRSNCDGVVLFSSANPARITANATDAESTQYSEQQLAVFLEFVDTIIPPATRLAS